MSIAVGQGASKLLLVLNHTEHLHVSLLAEPKSARAHHLVRRQWPAARQDRGLTTFRPARLASRVTETDEQLGDENDDLLRESVRPSWGSVKIGCVSQEQEIRGLSEDPFTV